MRQEDPQAFQELFDAEPAGSSSDAARWVELYRSLIDMMERQLEETRVFASRSPEALSTYLGRENIAILEEEIAAFKARLEHWTNAGAQRQ